MNPLQANDPRVRLLAPLYLRDVQEQLLGSAKSLRKARKSAWKSLRQANWLAEIAAQATSVQEISSHLETQGERWEDTKAQPRLHQLIHQVIDEQLRREVVESLRLAGNKVAEVLGLELQGDFCPDPAWIAQEQLILARAYIHALINWRRIDEFEEN